MLRLRHPLAASAIVTTLLGAVVFASPSFAASGDLLIAQATPSEETSATAPESEKGESQIEKRIEELHKKLRITPEQEAQWKHLADVMRENARKMQELAKERAKDVKSNAVEVVKSYSRVIEEHEKGMKKFIPAFQDLYEKLSDEQKKIADDLFRRRERATAKKETQENQ